MTEEQPKEDQAKKEALELLKLRSQLYKTLDEGFGKRLANDMSVNVVETLEWSRRFLKRFEQRYNN